MPVFAKSTVFKGKLAEGTGVPACAGSPTLTDPTRPGVTKSVGVAFWRNLPVFAKSTVFNDCPSDSTGSMGRSTGAPAPGASTLSPTISAGRSTETNFVSGASTASLAGSVGRSTGAPAPGASTLSPTISAGRSTETNFVSGASTASLAGSVGRSTGAPAPGASTLSPTDDSMSAMNIFIWFSSTATQAGGGAGDALLPGGSEDPGGGAFGFPLGLSFFADGSTWLCVRIRLACSLRKFAVASLYQGFCGAGSSCDKSLSEFWLSFLDELQPRHEITISSGDLAATPGCRWS